MNGYQVRADIAEKMEQLADLNERLAAARGTPEADGIGEQIVALEDTIESLEYDTEDLAEQLTMSIRNQEMEAEAYAKEAKLWAEKATLAKNRVQREKDLLKYVLTSNGITKLTAGNFKLTVANNGGKLPIRYLCAVEDLPVPFRLTNVTYKPNDEAIRTALDAGAGSEYFAYGERGTNLRIR